MPVQVIVREDGAYLLDGSHEVYMGGVPRVNPDGSCTVRYPARDVTVIQPLDHGRCHDFSDFVLTLIRVVQGDATIAEVQAVRPAMATAVQTYMTNHGLSPGGAP